MRQTGPSKLGGDHYCCHGAADLHQVWVGDHHQAAAEAHRPLVGPRCGAPFGLHRCQVLPSQTQPCAAAGEGAHQGGISTWKCSRYILQCVKRSCQLTSILMTGTPVRHRDPPGVEVQRVEGDLDGELVNETREEKKDK